MNSDLSDKTRSLNQIGAFLQIYVLDKLKKLDWATKSELPLRVSPFFKNPWKPHHIAGSRFQSMADMSLDQNKEPENPTNFVNSIKNSMDYRVTSETSLDIVAVKSSHFSDIFINLCVEVKKLNPKYNDWVFFKQSSQENSLRFIQRTEVPQTQNHTLFYIPKQTQEGKNSFLVADKRHGGFQYPVCDFGLALKNQKVESEYFKSEKTIVDESARQIIKGTFGYIINRLIDQILNGFPVCHHQIGYDWFIPIVVTNANLFICKHNVDDIDPESVHVTKDQEYEKVDSLIYECGEPPSVQFTAPLDDANPIRQTSNTAKWHVLVLTPKGFTDFLEKFEHQL